MFYRYEILSENFSEAFVMEFVTFFQDGSQPVHNTVTESTA